MKFSHSIQFNAVPEWSNHYLAYSNLKKLLYQLEKAVHQSQSQTEDVESRPLMGLDEPEDVFCRSLDVELEKISSFHVCKEAELYGEVAQLLQDVRGREPPDGAFFDHPARATAFDGAPAPAPAPPSENGAGQIAVGGDTDSEEDDDDEDDEPAGLIRRPSLSRRKPNLALSLVPTEMSGSTENPRSVHRRSTATTDFDDHTVLFSSSGRDTSVIVLKRRIVTAYVQLCELKSYVLLNRTGFGKVLKKFDKILDKELGPKYLEHHVHTAYPFRPENMKINNERIDQLVQAYTDVVTSGDRTLARRDLRSYLREHVVWERNTVWRDLIGIERRAEAAHLGSGAGAAGLLQGDDIKALDNTNMFATPFGTFSYPAWHLTRSTVSLAIGLVLFFGLLHTHVLQKPEQQNCLAILAFVSFLWATEAIPLFVTALMIPFLCVVLRVIRETDPLKKGDDLQRLGARGATAFVFASMWSPVIMLLMGGFTLAAALSKCRIDKRLATLVLSKAGTSPRTVLVANMFVAAFASMLISNVAAPVLCFSVIEPMLRTLPSDSSMSRAVILGIALASNIGGMLSPIASPQNVFAMQNMSPQPSWGQWFFIAIPVGVVSLLLIWAILLASFRPDRGPLIAPIKPIKERYTRLQWFVSLVTVATIVLWCLSSRLDRVFGDMGVIAILPILVFFGTGILSKEDFNNFPWTIIILAAGGIALGKAVESSGLLHVLAAVVSDRIHTVSLYPLLVTCALLVLAIATFISHSVAALILLPLVANVGRDLDDPKPNLLVMASVLMCSAAMALPTSGFPNMTAVMKEDPTGQRYLNVNHFLTRGLPSSLVTLVVIITLGYGLIELAGID